MPRRGSEIYNTLPRVQHIRLKPDKAGGHHLDQKTQHNVVQQAVRAAKTANHGAAIPFVTALHCIG